MARIITTPARLALVCCGVLYSAAGQEKPVSRQQFEVASIKPVDPNVPHMVGVKVYPGGRLVISALSLRALAAAAFDMAYWQIAGGDGWMENDRYDVEAKPPERAQSGVRNLRHTLFSIEDEHLRQMLQSLLVDRFQLKVRRETKTGDVYLLQRSGKPLALRPAEVPSSAEGDGAERSGFGSIGYVDGAWGIYATTMPQLARFASAFVLHAPVVDRTGLTGPFDFRQSVPDSEPNYSDNSASFLRFIPQLGLKLERSKGPVEILVIDHAEKPSPN